MEVHPCTRLKNNNIEHETLCNSSGCLGNKLNGITEIAAKFQTGFRNPALAPQVMVRNVVWKEVLASTAKDAPHFAEVHRSLKLEKVVKIFV